MSRIKEGDGVYGKAKVVRLFAAWAVVTTAHTPDGAVIVSLDEIIPDAEIERLRQQLGDARDACATALAWFDEWSCIVDARCIVDVRTDAVMAALRKAIGEEG